MPKTAPHMHPDPAAGSDIASTGAKVDTFPPLTVSLEVFVKDGSDHAFRELMFGLIALNNQMRIATDRFARHIGTNNSQFHILMALAQTPDMTASQIAELTNVASPIVTIEIGSLVRKGLIERRANESNRRNSFLSLTAKGRDLVCQVAPLLRRVNDLHYRSLTAEQAAVLKASVDAIVTDGRRVIAELDSAELDSGE
jgi:DNA-binding MarR family transcriptional regulator